MAGEIGSLPNSPLKIAWDLSSVAPIFTALRAYSFCSPATPAGISAARAAARFTPGGFLGVAHQGLAKPLLLAFAIAI
jgi:hypothetical protein